MKKLLMFLLLGVFLMSFVSAVWWNPFTWFDDNGNVIKESSWVQIFSDNPDIEIIILDNSKHDADIYLCSKTLTKKSDLKDLDFATSDNKDGKNLKIKSKLKPLVYDGRACYYYKPQDNEKFLKFDKHSTHLVYTNESITYYENDEEVSRLSLITRDYKYKNSKPNIDVSRGEDKLTHIFYLKSYSNESITNLRVVDMNTSLELERNIKLRWLSYVTVEIPTYNIVCEDGFENKYEISGLECNQTQNGTKEEIREVWNEMNTASQGKDYIVGVFADIEKNDYADIDFDFYGESILQSPINWATWTESLNVDLYEAWKLDETSGTTSYGELGSLNLSFSGSPTINQTTAKDGTSYYFDGSDSLVKSSIGTEFGSTNDFSYSVWVRPDAQQDPSSDTGYIFYLGDGSSANPSHGFNLYDIDNTFRYRDASGQMEISATTWSANTWYHIAMVYDGTTMQIFINGNWEMNETSTTSIASNPTLRVGWFDNNYQFVGEIDEPYLWNRSLTNSEVVELANDTFFEETSDEDITSPTYSLNQINNTLSGESTLFSLYWDDDTALESNGQYVFSTNNTGSWVNDSAINFTSTPQWANITKTLNDTTDLSIGYRWYVTDNEGNENASEIFILTTIEEADSTHPYFTDIPTNATLVYKNNTLGVDFDATDETSFGTFYVNDSRFAINSTGWLSNNTILGVAAYEINVSIDDSSGNENYTIYKVTVNQNVNSCDVLFNETSPLTYQETFLVWSNCNSDFTLYRNGTEIINNTEQDLGAGSYNFTVIRTDQSNYTNTDDEEIFVINKKASSVYTYLNNSRSNVTIYQNQVINLSGVLNEGDVETGIGLYNNGTLINNGPSPLSNLTNFTDIGLYNITSFFPGTNNWEYSYETFWVTVLIQPSENTVVSTINSPDNESILYSNPGEFNCSATATGDYSLKNVSIWTNQTGLWEVGNYTDIGDYSVVAQNTSTVSIPTGDIDYHLVKTIDISNYVNKTINQIRVTDLADITCKIVYYYNNGSTLEVTQSTSSNSFVNKEYENANKDEKVNYIEVYLKNQVSGSAGAEERNTYIYGEDKFEVTEIISYELNDSITWTCQACLHDGTCNFSSENRTFYVDVELPQISIEVPIGELESGLVGAPETLNFTVTDNSLDSCWYNYNGTNISVTGCVTGVKNTTTFILEPSNTNLTVYANDTLGRISSSFTEWNYTVFEIDSYYSPTVTEGTSTLISVNISIQSGLRISQAKLIYDGESNTGSFTEYEDDIYYIYSNLEVPQVDNESTKNFFWDITLENDEYYSTIPKNQTILNLNIDDCSVYSNIVFNFTVVDELTQNILNATLENVSVQLGVSLKNPNNDEIVLNFSNDYDEENPVQFCIESNLSGTTYDLDAIIQYSSGNRFMEFYNINDFELTEDTLNQNITLYDLGEEDGQEFKITYKGQDFVPITDMLVQIQKKYIGEGVFKTVEIPMTGSTGYAVAHLTPNDAIYNLIFIKDGVVLDTFSEVVVSCQNPTISECELNLNALITGNDLFDIMVDDEFLSSMSFNKTSREVSATYSILSGVSDTVTLNVTLLDNFGNNTVCSDSLFSSGGTLSCVVPDSFGNATIYSKLIWNEEIKRDGFISLKEQPRDQYLGVLILSSVILLMFIFGMGISDNPSITGIFLILGVFLLGALNLIYTTSWIGAGATILWFVIAVVVLLIKGGSRR